MKFLRRAVEVLLWQAKLGCGCRTGIRISPMFFILTVELVSNTEDFGLVFGRDVRLFQHGLVVADLSFEVGDGFQEAILEGHNRLPVQQSLCNGQVWTALFRVIGCREFLVDDLTG